MKRKWIGLTLLLSFAALPPTQAAFQGNLEGARDALRAQSKPFPDGKPDRLSDLRCRQEARKAYSRALLKCRQAGGGKECEEQARVVARKQHERCIAKRNPTEETETTTEETPVNATQAALIRSNPARYRLIREVRAENTRYALQSLTILLPVPADGPDQAARLIEADGSERLTAIDSDNVYLRFRYSGASAPGPGSSVTARAVFEVTLYDLETDFVKVDAARRKPEHPAYQHYLGANAPYVLPGEPRLQTIADRLWSEAGQNRREYARRAYEYVAANYSYQRANTGIHPLNDVLAWNGGDCGNLSSIYISLLRNKGLAARHQVGILADGQWHAWAEVFFDDAGWIPVDVTFKNGDRNGDYFGRLVGTRRLTLHRNLNLRVEIQPGQSVTAPLLQNFAWWVWGQGNIEGAIAPHMTTRLEPL